MFLSAVEKWGVGDDEIRALNFQLKVHTRDSKASIMVLNNLSSIATEMRFLKTKSKPKV